jgi:hypothetical protein
MQHAHYEQKQGHGHPHWHKPALRARGRKDVEPCCHCGEKDQVVPILFGFPTHAAFMKAERGEVYLGGCEVSPYIYFCKRCDREF